MEFVEIRVHVLDANGRPAELTRVKAEITLRPAQGPARTQAMQLMLPHGPGLDAPEGRPFRLSDGRSVIARAFRPSAPFVIAPGTAAYFKADRDWPSGESDVAAELKIVSPEGESKGELRLKV